ncbi:hypothetical protein SAMN04515648_0170 [Phyllobacterium sp. CL33Tsu]|nr:hypothetical protein SAMN04515648_0170 [Phyllobacterium sp. CL33Tsu]
MDGRGSHPPLSCRTSPPQGGRPAFKEVEANLQGLHLSDTLDDNSVSPLVGEMSGRTEGGD